MCSVGEVNMVGMNYQSRIVDPMKGNHSPGQTFFVSSSYPGQATSPGVQKPDPQGDYIGARMARYLASRATSAGCNGPRVSRFQRKGQQRDHAWPLAS